MPIDIARQLQDLLRTAEAFRRAMIVSGAVNHVGQSTYMDELRALESALQPMNYSAATVWKCRKCSWQGIEPDTAPANNHGYAYRAAACPECGLYFNDDDFKTAAAIECWSIVERLRAPEGAEVILFCDNPEPIAGTSPNNAIEICDDWTGWKRRRFEGDSILDALRGALAARAADEILKNQERKDSGR